MSEVDLRNNPEILEIFLAEARRRLKDAETILKDGEVPEPGSEGFETLHRHAHTLKGLGATLGYKDMEARSLDILDHLKAAARLRSQAVWREASREILHDFEKLAADVDVIAQGPGALSTSGHAPEGSAPVAADADAGAHDPLGPV